MSWMQNILVCKIKLKKKHNILWFSNVIFIADLAELLKLSFTDITFSTYITDFLVLIIVLIDQN